MEIWGVQIPIDYVVVGGAILTALLVVTASIGFKRWFFVYYWRSRVLRAVNEMNEMTDQLVRVDSEYWRTRSIPIEQEVESQIHPTNQQTGERKVLAASLQLLGRSRRVTFWIIWFDRAVLVLNILTSLLALSPLVGAVIAVLSEHPNLARQLDVVGLVVLIVTKGGLWLLTMVLIPFLTALPKGAGIAAGGHIINRVLNRRDKDREPAEKK